MSNVLEVSCLDKYYGDKRVLDSLSFSLRDGECCTLLGPNGVGKTTLIKVICGLEKTSSGSIKIASFNLAKKRHQALRAVGMMPQDFNINLVLNARQIFILNGMYLGNSYKRSKQKADELIDLLDLTDYKKEKAENLSGGKKRSLMLGKALVGSPKLLILDEPTAGIDISIKTRIFDHLKRLKKEGVSILLVTHIVDEIEKVSDTVAVLKEGKINQHLSIEDIKLASLSKVYRLKVNSTKEFLSSDFIQCHYNVVDPYTLEISMVDESKTLDAHLKILASLDVHVFDIERVSCALEEFAMENYKC